MKLLELFRESGTPIRRQIYEQIRAQILCGTLAAGEPLPSTRLLAGELSVSRSTVVEAYDMLLAEGFLNSRQGAQTVVSEGLVIGTQNQPQARETNQPNKNRIFADFSTGKPDLNLFPRAQWVKLLSSAAANLSPQLYGYTGPQGYRPLQEEISTWLSRSRGMQTQPEDIFITAGATQALRVLTDLLCGNGGRVLVEDPCHKGLYDTLRVCNCEIIPALADDHGLQTDFLDSAKHANMIYVTPSHQFPLGGILPATRRAALIRFAREQSAYIVEDDYDSEFRYTGAPIAPLYSLDAQRVIYVGTFSKSLFPALRIGFVILPKCLQTRWRDLRTHHDVQNPMFEQAALAELLRTRKFDRHVHQMKQQYDKRRKLLLNALQDCFGNDWSVCGDAAGLHVTIRFSGMSFDSSFLSRCKEAGVHAVPLEEHCIIKGNHTDALVLGYGHLEPQTIESNVRLLAEVIHECRQPVSNMTMIDKYAGE